MIYVGVGSRSCPPNEIARMEYIGELLSYIGYTLRSGGAKGSDLAFEKGCDVVSGPKEIYYAYDATGDAMKVAESVHPAWQNCDDYAKRLHGRNAMQVLGRDLQEPADFLICWTKDGQVKGGTATAINIAGDNGIPVYNLALESDRLALKSVFSVT